MEIKIILFDDDNREIASATATNFEDADEQLAILNKDYGALQDPAR